METEAIIRIADNTKQVLLIIVFVVFIFEVIKLAINDERN